MSSSNQFSDQTDNTSSAPKITVGAMLREARASAGLTSEELARRLCMRADKLEALEQDDFSRFAGATYVRGYIRNLCKELGLDTVAVMAAFARQVPVETVAEPARVPVGAVMTSRGEKHGGSLFIPLVLALAVAAGGGYWWFDQQGSSANHASQVVSEGRVDSEPQGSASSYGADTAGESVEPEFSTAGFTETRATAETVEASESGADDGTPVTDAELAVAGGLAEEGFIAEAQPEPARDAVEEPAVQEVAEPVAPAQVATARIAEIPKVDSESASVQSETSQPESTPAEARLVISFQQESWVEVSDSTGYKMIAKLQPAGSRIELDGRAPFSVMLGNAAGATVTYDGQTVDSAPIGNRRTRKLSVGG